VGHDNRGYGVSRDVSNRTRQWGPRFDRRKFLRLSAVAGGLAMAGPVAAACTSSSKTPPSSTPTTGVVIAGTVPGPAPVSGGRTGGRVVAGYTTPPDSNDPAQSYNLFSYDIVTELVFFGGLLAYGSQFGGPIPNLASKMPEISSDKTTFTFTLRPGVKFHNGREITAEDVKYAWERVLLPATAAWGSSYFADIVGAKDMLDGRTKSLDGVDVVNSKTLKVQLETPNFTFLNAVSQPFSSPVPREEVERLGDKWGKTPVGFGPFKIESQDESSQVAHLVRFDDYFWKGLPYLDEVEMHWGSTDATLLLQLKSGAIGLIADGIPGTLIGQAQSDPSLSDMVKGIPVHQNLKFMFNVTEPPLDDVQVRQALNLSINRENISKVLHGTGVPDGAPFPLNLGFTPTFSPYGYEPDKAKQLLTEAGATDLQLTITSDTSDPWPTIAQIVQQNFADIGVKSDIQQLKSNVYLQLAQQGKLDMWPDGWYMVQPTPADIVDNQYVTNAGSNYSGFSDPQVDQLASQADTSFTVADQNQLYAQIEKLIGVAAPALFLVNGTYYGGVNPTRIANWHYRGEYGNYFDRMWVPA
jgi:ABC-type transport system substrate-binding protein